MSTASIISSLDRELASKGFRRKKATWNRDCGSLVDVIDIQTSKGGNAVTLNAGVLSRSIHLTCWGQEAEPFIEEPLCTVRARVGQLLDNKDVWWDVNSSGVSDEIVGCLGARIFPFLERMRTPEGMRDWLLSTGIPSLRYPLPSLYFAVLQSQLGDVRAAAVLLADLEHKALGAWKIRAHEVAVRIGSALHNN